jgi:acyl carrier protein
MAANDAIQKHLARSGMETMPPDDAFAALEMALFTRESRLAIAPVDWPKYLSQIPAGQQSFYSEILREKETGAQQDVHRAGSADGSARAPESRLAAVLAVPAAARKPAVRQLAEDVVRRTLDLRSSEEIDPDEAFSDLGMDSLLAVELRNNLSALIEQRLPSTLVFDYPTLQKLARFIEQELFPAAAEGAETVRPGAETEAADDLESLNILDDIEQLSDEEINSIFEKGAR